MRNVEASDHYMGYIFHVNKAYPTNKHEYLFSYLINFSETN